MGRVAMNFEKSMGREIQDDMLAHEAYFDSLFNSGIWLTGKGEEIQITDMTVDHIKNCISMLNKHGGDDCYINVLEQELKRRNISK